jgi:hypothetical protein
MSVKGSSSSTTTRTATALVGEIDKNIKYKTIEPFTGERNKLTGFLLQLRLYVKFNGERFRSETEQVLWAVTLLEGKAIHWIEGFLEDYLQNTNALGEIKEDKMEDTTVKIFKTWNGFLEEIKVNFGVMDERKEAERAIESLRQKGSATSYTRDFQRYSTRTEWGDEALRYQYRKGLKDFVKDELLRTGHSTDTLESLITAACEIDNAWYERSMEKKGKYDPDYKRMGEGRNRTQRSYNVGRGDPMELDATGPSEPKKWTLEEKRKLMDERKCFNCGRPGHMARNCKTSRGRGQGRRGQLNATSRRDYSGPMQINATGWKPADEEEFVQVTQSLDAMNFVRTAGDDASTDGHSTSTDDSDPALTEEEIRTAQIMAGQETAYKFYMESQDRQTEGFLRTQFRYGRIAKEPMDASMKRRFLEDKLLVMSNYRYEILCLQSAIEGQTSEHADAEQLGINRSQQYQDKMAMNQNLLPVIKEEIEKSRREKKAIHEELETLRENENVARIDHPRHAELAWSFCYTDSCSIHRSSKEGAGYWPTKKRPVYWGKTTISTTAPLEAAEQSKN